MLIRLLKTTMVTVAFALTAQFTAAKESEASLMVGVSIADSVTHYFQLQKKSLGSEP